MSGKNKNHKKVSENKSKEVMHLTKKDLRNDPIILKKIESSKRIMEKYGFPKELLNS
jgi:hypothetical protein